jgi:hypothetical protein
MGAVLSRERSFGVNNSNQCPRYWDMISKLNMKAEMEIEQLMLCLEWSLGNTIVKVGNAIVKGNPTCSDNRSKCSSRFLLF